MGAREVITAVMAELSIDVPAVSWGIRQITEGNAPPRIDWEPMQGSFRGPQMAGHNPRPLRDRWTRWDVWCWGATLDDTDLQRSLVEAQASLADAELTRIQSVGHTLTQVVDGVRNVSDRLRTIAEASTQQSVGLAEVTKTVGALEDITLQNAAMVEESAKDAGELVHRAQALGEAVASIRLRQGSADEARALVEKAHALVSRDGVERASQVFTQADGGFIDRDLYIFIVDREGRYLVHGLKPAMNGHRVHELPGIDGDRFVREAWAAATGNGHHWVEYDIVNPDSGKVQPKASYVEALNDRLLLGCGIYRSNSAAAAARAPAGAGPSSAPNTAAMSSMAQALPA